ncbi:nucleotidyltransferase family protein [candidate division KSB1 bacterium]|nr:nucleotidyltransferase family protein [candidate division KSB1 bacterium]
MKLSAIILAAGKGRRIAELGDKPLLILNDKSFLEIIIEKISHAGFLPIIVITNHKLYERLRNLNIGDIAMVINPTPDMGMISSIHCGMDCLPPDSSGFLLHPVDYPLVKATTYTQLHEKHEQAPHHIIIPIHEHKNGHPMIFPADTFDQLRRAPLEIGARYIVRQKTNSIAKIRVNDPGVLLNINTAELYRLYCSKNDG